MGLSASQARLLSITARISDNELHSQQIANAKVALANQTQEASREYVNSLDAKKLVYTMYDAKGNSTQVNLTPAVLYQFSELKNQYGISNSVGQLLVSAQDAENYKNSGSVYDFLRANGIDCPQEPKLADYPSKSVKDFIKGITLNFGTNVNGFSQINGDNGTNAYINILAKILGTGTGSETYTTSTNDNFTLYDGSSSTPSNYDWCYVPTGVNNDDLSKILTKQSVLESDKTIKQVIIDFLYEAATEIYDNSTIYGGSNWNGTSTDSSAQTHTPEVSIKYQEYLQKFYDIINYDLSRNPKEYFETDNTTFKIAAQEVINTNPEAQWYINLWHRMNGESDYKTTTAADSTDGTSGKYWKVLEDNLLKSSSWLQYALEQGLVTLEQVQKVDEAETETGLKTTKWKSKEFTTCVDIQFVDDETAVARAEAVYTKKLKDIESKDKKYDNDIKKLDTEHNALQTEYDSVKNVISKNIDRSFKAFS